MGCNNKGDCTGGNCCGMDVPEYTNLEWLMEQTCLACDEENGRLMADEPPFYGKRQEYPCNWFFVTPRRIMVEYDNTEDFRRFHIFHPMVTSWEIEEHGDSHYHVRRDLYNFVERNFKEGIGGYEKKYVISYQELEVKDYRKVTVTKDETKLIKEDKRVTVNRNEHREVLKDQFVTVKKNTKHIREGYFKIKVGTGSGDNYEFEVTGDGIYQIGEKLSIAVGKSAEVVAKNIKLDGSGGQHPCFGVVNGASICPFILAPHLDYTDQVKVSDQP